MSEEDQTVDVTMLPKFDMPSYESEMTSKDVKSLALQHRIPLELHPVALTKGWTMDQLRAIPDAMVWRHHDSDFNDPVPEDGFQASDVLLLTERVIGLQPVPSGLLFYGGLATTWDFPGFCPIFKDTEGNDRIEQHTVRPLPIDQTIPEKTAHQKEVEVEDPKIVAARERKARVTAKKRERRHQGGDGGEGSRPATKRKKTSARRDGAGASEATSSPEPIRTINPNKPSTAVAETAESREDRSPHESPQGLADHSVHNYSDAHQGDEGVGTLQLEASGRAITHIDTEVVQPTPSPQDTFHSNVEVGKPSKRSSLYVPDWSIPQRCHLDTPMWCRELMTHLAPPAAQEESNALNNPMALERAYSDLYNSLSDRFKAFRSEHEGCSGKLKASESRNRELSQVNQDQALRIKELEDTLAKKDSALVYAERLNVERAQEKEKLVSQLARTEKEKYDCVSKLLPNVVERLFQSHEYKQILSGPFNLAIQVRWGKGLAKERSEEGLLKLMGRMEGFDVHADTKMKVEYEKLFER
ncbi:hypothetical protein Tco_0086796 [Tanacetum coccineum]